jgi:cyclopropane fatty-acyl-phospholipid synthase-like methyltransferase
VVALTTPEAKARASDLRLSRIPRYAENWRAPFIEAVGHALRPGIAVLDVGAGRSPVLTSAQRPPDCYYVGLDISRDELNAAGEAAYDAIVEADAAQTIPSLRERFDVVVSWQALEHITPLENAITNIHSYLQDGGSFFAHVSGRLAVTSLLNRMLPECVGRRLMTRLLPRAEEDIFRAHYDRCTYTQLQELLKAWSTYEIHPRYACAGYFAFSKSLQELYLQYEDWAMRSRRDNLATHYLVVAQK